MRTAGEHWSKWPWRRLHCRPADIRSRPIPLPSKMMLGQTSPLSLVLMILVWSPGGHTAAAQRRSRLRSAGRIGLCGKGDDPFQRHRPATSPAALKPSSFAERNRSGARRHEDDTDRQSPVAADMPLRWTHAHVYRAAVCDGQEGNCFLEIYEGEGRPPVILCTPLAASTASGQWAVECLAAAVVRWYYPRHSRRSGSPSSGWSAVRPGQASHSGLHLGDVRLLCTAACRARRRCSPCRFERGSPAGGRSGRRGGVDRSRSACKMVRQPPLRRAARPGLGLLLALTGY
jgi:hypothetical protein